MAYSSRHFGDAWMNVQKVLRRPPGGKGDPIVYRWAYHAYHMDRHGDLLEHHLYALGIEALSREVAQGKAPITLTIDGNPTQTEYQYGAWLPTNFILDRYRQLTDAAAFRRQKALLHPAVTHNLPDDQRLQYSGNNQLSYGHPSP